MAVEFGGMDDQAVVNSTARRRQPKSVCLMVTHESTANVFYRHYLEFLRESGWTVSIVTSSLGTLRELGNREGVAAYDLPMRREPSPLRDAVSLVRAVILLLRLRPEVIVAATPKAGLLGMVAGWLTRVPVRVYQLWGLRLETETGWRRALFIILEKTAARLATQVVANSTSLAQEAEALGIGNSMTVLGEGSSHGVDLEYFDRTNVDIPELPPDVAEKLAERPDALTVGFVGRVHRDKGVDTLIEAVERCVRSGIDVNLLIVGSSEDENIEALMSRPSVPGLVIVRVGPVSDTRPFFLAMDLHCLPTMREGFPNVVLEASALGIPTITTTATGARDSVRAGVTGIIVKAGSSEDLADAISSLGNDRSRITLMGKKARAWVSRSFGKKRMWLLQEENLSRQIASYSSSRLLK